MWRYDPNTGCFGVRGVCGTRASRGKNTIRVRCHNLECQTPLCALGSWGTFGTPMGAGASQGKLIYVPGGGYGSGEAYVRFTILTHVSRTTLQ